MKISGTKKLLLICFSLIIALTVSLFLAHNLSLKTYAEVSPDGSSAYADGDTGNIPPDSAIVDPKPFDPDHKEEQWTLTIQQVTLEFGKLIIRVDDWNENGLSTSPDFNANPDGIYNSRPDLVSKIQSMIADSDFISLVIYDVEGNIVTDTSNLAPGTTLFIHAVVNEKYADSVSLTYKDGVPSSYAYTTDFPASEKLKKVPELTDTEFEFVYDGTELDFQKLVLDDVLKDRDTYLMFVASESDALKQNSAGEFTLRICFKNGVKYCWDTDVPNDRHAIEIKIKVNPKTLSVTADLGDKYYTGYNIDIAEELKKIYGEYVIVATGYDTVAKVVGDYTFNVLINPKYSVSVKWEEGVEDPVTITWHIKQSVITGDWGSKGDFGKITITSDTYPGEQAGDIEYIYKDMDDNVVTKLEKDHDYTVEVVLKNPNLVWSEDPGPHSFTLTKELVEFEKPVINVTTVEYSGTEVKFEVTIGGVSIDDPQFADYIEIVSELSDPLNPTNAGKYKVVIRLKDGSASWTGNVSGDVVLEFEITQVVIGVEWDDESGTPIFDSTLASGDYSGVVKVTYKNSKGEEIKKSQMVKGETYIGILTLIDETNFVWKEGADLAHPFTFNIDLTTLDQPKLPANTFDFTGNVITVSVENKAQLDEYIAQGYIEIVSGSFSQTNAGTHTIVLKIKNSSCVWADAESEYVTLTFTINKAVLKGEWQSNGKVKFESSFLGNYDDVVEYVYTNSNGEVVKYSELVEGETYTVSVKLKEGMDKNFDDSQLPAPTTITFKATDGENGGGIPWWVWLIVGLAILLIIIIILIIILILKKRKKDDDYDDFYGDEYYGDEENGEDNYGSDEGGYDDYGDTY